MKAQRKTYADGMNEAARICMARAKYHQLRKTEVYDGDLHEQPMQFASKWEAENCAKAIKDWLKEATR